MLAANLPVCQYAGMPGPSNSNNSTSGGSNNNNNTTSGGNNNNNNNSISTNSNNNNGGNGSSNVGLVGGGTSAAAAKNQLEQLNTMREALFSQDGWGCQHVNQDTNWEVPSSPEPTNKDAGGPPLWKPTINNGTDLWESTLRNGGQPATQPVQKTPWGHTPSSNLGGTWGEDDDGTDSSSVWTGGAGANSTSSNSVGVAGSGSSVVGSSVGGGGGPSTGGSQWGQGTVGGVGGGAGGTSVVNVGTSGAGGAASGDGATGNGWGDPRNLRILDPRDPIRGDLRSVDPRDQMRAASAGDPRDLRILDPRDPIRGDPRGISGRLNGTSEMWGQHHPITHSQMPAMNKMVGPGVVVGGNVATAVVAGGGISGIGPGGVGVINTGGGGVSGNVSSQWGAGQTVVGSKDITSMAGKQVTGWEEPSPPPQRRNIPNYDDGTSLWGQQSRVPGGGSHWKDISDPMNRNHLIRGTIGNQNASNVGHGGVVAGLGVGGGASGLGSGQANAGIGAAVGVGNSTNPMVGVGQARLAGAVGPGSGGQHKPDNAMWVHPSGAGVGARNATSWVDDGTHNVGAATSSNWVDDKSNSGIGQLSANVTSANSWNDTPASWIKNQNKISASGGAAGWGATAAAISNDGSDLTSDWSVHSGIVSKSQQKIVSVSGLNTDVIRQSKQYRVLVDTGFKKDDVERALISANMNIEEAAEMLRANATIMDSWRRHDETLGSYADHSNSTVGGGGYPGRYPAAGTQPTMSFPPNNVLSSMGGSAGGNNHNLAALNSMQPLQVQKYLNQGAHNVAGPQSINAATAVSFGQSTNVTAAAVNAAAASNSSNQPSAQQLRMLVQQIQLAVHSGYLSSQILNQPLAPATLLLLNQLLSNIKHLQGAQQSLVRGNNANNMQLNAAINKYKTTIQSLQSQINAQQAMYIKQQQALQQQQHQQQQQQQQQQNAQQHPSATHVSNTNTEYMRGQHDTLNALQASNFSEINLNKPSGYQGAPNQQSRLTQWKLPVTEKDLTSDSTDFSRAPGTTKQNLSGGNTNMGPLGLQNEGTWSTGRIGDGWPDSSNENENKDWSVAQPTTATAYTDLVQEFEPGKPWKGSQIKSIEDDPSITPGSVARSPLSINSTPKEADIFANASKNSPTDLPPLSLSSSTWSFNPTSSNQNFPTWSDNTQQCATSELWAAPMNKTSRGPPPGLSTNKGGVSVSGVATVTNANSVISGSANGWLVGGTVVGRSGSGVPITNSGWTTTTNASWNSNWLLLKSLTAQIDGSTLRTLCMQHGPLLNFHLYVNQGIALCKYATREEANKAQMTLNNCVLGNTTICAESPSENEVQNLLQHLPPTSNTAVTPNGGNGCGASGSNSAGNGNGGASNGAGNSGNCSAGSSVVNGAVSSGVNNTNGTAATVSSSSANNSQVHSGGANVNTVNNANGAVNAVGGNSGAGGNSNNSTNSGPNNSATNWRQAQNQQQQQQQQNQLRPPAGRETDFDLISKYVCSIVDD